MDDDSNFDEEADFLEENEEVEEEDSRSEAEIHNNNNNSNENVTDSDVDEEDYLYDNDGDTEMKNTTPTDSPRPSGYFEGIDGFYAENRALTNDEIKYLRKYGRIIRKSLKKAFSNFVIDKEDYKVYKKSILKLKKSIKKIRKLYRNGHVYPSATIQQWHDELTKFVFPVDDFNHDTKIYDKIHDKDYNFKNLFYEHTYDETGNDTKSRIRAISAAIEEWIKKIQ